MLKHETVRVNPTKRYVTDDQGYGFTVTEEGTEVVKTPRIARKLSSGELVVVSATPTKPSNKEVKDGK